MPLYIFLLYIREASLKNKLFCRLDYAFIMSALESQLLIVMIFYIIMQIHVYVLYIYNNKVNKSILNNTYGGIYLYKITGRFQV